MIEIVSRLPAEYQEVEYIQSSGTQYIDTGFKPSVNTKIIGDAQWVSITNYPMLCGVYESNSNRFAMFYQTAWTAWIADKVVNISGDYSGRKTIVLDKDAFVVSGTSKVTNASDFASTKSMYVFAMNHPNGVLYYANLRLYSLQIYESDTISRDFVPCYRKMDGVVGLYDLVNSMFYINAGTGTFTKGADVDGSIAVTPGGIIPQKYALRRRMMVSSNAPFAFEYTGNYTDNRDANGIGTVEFTSSGILTVLSGIVTVLVHILGAGGGGAQIGSSKYSGGGSGGYQTIEVKLVPGTYDIVIGTGGEGIRVTSGWPGAIYTGSTGGKTTAFGFTSTGGSGGEVASGSSVTTYGKGGKPNGNDGTANAGGSPNGGTPRGGSDTANSGGNGIVRLTFS